MEHSPHLRVVISCVTFETVKIVEPILAYKADRAYLLHMSQKDVYKQFLAEVIQQLNDHQIQCIPIEEQILNFDPVMKTMVNIIHKERSENNHVYVNISAGTRIFTSAALIACMMEGGHPFDVRTDEFMIKKDDYFDGDKPIGISKSVYDPVSIPSFKIHPPSKELLLALRCWKKVENDKGRVNQIKVIIELEKHNLIEIKYEKTYRGKQRVSGITQMQFRRRYLDKWVLEGWMEREQRGHYQLSAMGNKLLTIYGDLI